MSAKQIWEDMPKAKRLAVCVAQAEWVAHAAAVGDLKINPDSLDAVIEARRAVSGCIDTERLKTVTDRAIKVFREESRHYWDAKVNRSLYSPYNQLDQYALSYICCVTAADVYTVISGSTVHPLIGGDLSFDGSVFNYIFRIGDTKKHSPLAKWISEQDAVLDE